jgi:25S rRNA (cytosine2278-C5)-methyltransferase
MSLYHEAADVLSAPTNIGGSLKSRIFSNKDLKSQPAQIYALAIETCKWSPILKEVIEHADILRLERKVCRVRLRIGKVLIRKFSVITDSLPSARA